MKYQCISLLVLSILALVATQRIGQKNKDWYTTPGNPGLRIRLTRKGVNYMRKVGVGLLAQEIPKIKGISASAAFAGGSVHLSNMHVTSFKPPSLSVVNLNPPRSVVIGLENMDVGLAGDFLGRQGPWQVPGTMVGTAKGMTLAITMDLKRGPGGKLQGKVTSCKAVIKNTNFNVNPTGPLAPFVAPYRPAINNGIRSGLPSLLCQSLKGMVEDAANKLFTNFTQIDLGEIARQKLLQDKAASDGLPVDILKDLTEGLIVKNQLVDSPVVTRDYIDLPLTGEIRYKESVQTPFYPKPMPKLEDQSKMFYVTGSDYILNSMLYHAYNQGKMKLRINKKMLPPAYNKVLDTTCSTDTGGSAFSRLCIGSLIPALGKNYPHQSTEMLMIPHGLPTFQFLGDKGKLNGKGRIMTYTSGKQVLVINAEGQSDMTLNLTGTEKPKVSGTMTVKKLRLSVWRSALHGLKPKSVSQLGHVVKGFLGPQLSEALAKGTPLPGGKLVKFIKPEFALRQGVAEFSSDIEIDEVRARHLVATAVKQGAVG